MRTREPGGLSVNHKQFHPEVDDANKNPKRTVLILFSAQGVPRGSLPKSASELDYQQNRIACSKWGKNSIEACTD